MGADSMIGKTIADKLKIASVLGEGSVGVVYLAEHAVLERLFAVKILRREMTSNRMAVERFHREAKAASRLLHRNVVYISDFGRLTDGRFYLIMEYVPGESLAEESAKTSYMRVHRACRILLQTAEALDYAHNQGVAHRDLKPENIILAENPGLPETVKVLDFGLAKILFGKTTPITFRGEMFGTPAFMAPEQIKGGETDHRVDIYALGVMTFELLTGRTPFTGTVIEMLSDHRKKQPPKPSEANPSAEIPSIIDDLVLKAMEKSPENRFATAEEMASIYRSVLADPQVRVVERKPQGGDKNHSELVSAERKPAEIECRFEEKDLQRSSLYAFAQTLIDRRRGGPDIVRQLALCLELEENLHNREAETAYLASGIRETMASNERRKARLLCAIHDLQREAENCSARDKHPETESEPADLNFQIGSLQNRLREVEEKTATRLNVLNEQFRQSEEELQKLRVELQERDKALLQAASPFNLPQIFTTKEKPETDT